jgi:hypothetical protein
MSVEIYEGFLGEDEHKTKFAIFRGGLHSDNPTQILNEAVAKYIGDIPHNQFVDITLCNPWYRIIIEYCRKLEYQTLESLQRDERIRNILGD